MDSEELKALQAPFKQKYQETPEAAEITLKAEGVLDDHDVACSVDTGRAMIEAGLHPSTGGTGLQACSGDMLLQALAACAGVTLRAAATATGIPVAAGRVHTSGILDVRGTLAVDKNAPVGFKSITLRFDLVTEASQEDIDRLVQLTERYCVVYQTLRNKPPIDVVTTILPTAAQRARGMT